MKTFHEEIPDLCQDALTDQLFDEHSIFFDIETTGFSPANSTLYMIGCARRKSNRICIDQFFAEKPEEEAEILAAFFQMLSPYTTIITFNGVGFDIPYLKASLVTIITLLMLSVGNLLGGTAIVESIFMWDGVGKMAVDAISMRDYPIIQAYVMWMAIIYVVVNLLTDLSYRFLDPRIRLGGVKQ